MILLRGRRRSSNQPKKEVVHDTTSVLLYTIHEIPYLGTYFHLLDTCGLYKSCLCWMKFGWKP